MGWKYCNLRAQKDAENMVYDIELFAHSESVSIVAPVIGSLASWAPTTAYVIGFKQDPDGPHFTYEIRAKTNSSIQASEQDDGIHYKTLLFLEDGDSRIPSLGALATWAPTAAYITGWKTFIIGTYKGYEIEARSVPTVTRHHSDKGVYYERLSYTSSSAMLTLPTFGDEVTWAPEDADGKKAYIFDIESKMMGDGFYYVTQRACEAKYNIGVS